tara:strand:- start:58813 stop:59106 length:294 start_codon:yes stop_codon:yes gene_type:complete
MKVIELKDHVNNFTEVYKAKSIEFYGQTVVGKSGQWGGEMSFVTNINGRSFTLRDASSDECLLADIAELKDEELKQIRNFMETMGMKLTDPSKDQPF